MDICSNLLCPITKTSLRSRAPFWRYLGKKATHINILYVRLEKNNWNLFVTKFLLKHKFQFVPRVHVIKSMKINFNGSKYLVFIFLSQRKEKDNDDSILRRSENRMNV